MKVKIAIDPGKSGGIAIRYADGRVALHAMPDTETELMETLKSEAMNAYSEGCKPECVLERVGGFAGKGQPGSAMFTFGRGVGVIVGLLLAYQIPFREVRPQDWQKAVGAGTTSGRSKAQWKRHLCDLARKRFPTTKGITLKTCDALLMLAAMEGAQ